MAPSASARWGRLSMRPAVAQEKAKSMARHACSRARSSGERPLVSRTLRRGVAMAWVSASTGVRAVKYSSPVRRKKKTAARLKTSLQGPMARGSPVMSSGAPKPGVPTTAPMKVALMPSGRATPKSAILKISSSPKPQQSTLSGLRSRWITPTSCTAERPFTMHSTARAARLGSNAEPVAWRLWSTRSESVVPSAPPCTYSTTTQGTSTVAPRYSTGKVPVSMKRTTKGVGGTRSLSRPSAMASFFTIRAAVGPALATNEGLSILTTTGSSPPAATRIA